MIILGIMYSTNSSAALMRDGEIVAAAGEDRFLRKKSTHAYPREAVDHCLKIAGVSASEIDLVALPYLDINSWDRFIVDYDGTFSIQEKIREQHDYFYPTIIEKKEVDFLEVFKDKIIPQRLKLAQEDPEGNPIHAYLKEHLGISREKIRHYHHHLSHIYYGIFSARHEMSEPVLILTMEGNGGDRNASVATFADGELTTIYRTDDCFLARLYRYVTLLLGMKSNEHEYKVMGLAPYASDYVIQKPLEIFREYMYLDGLEMKYHKRPPDLYHHFRKLFEGFRFDAIAGALQRYTEEIVTQWTRNAVKQTGIGRVIWSGGVAMNIKAMMEVSKIPEVDDLWVGATPGDESLTMGVLFQAFHRLTGQYPKHLNNMYLGNDHTGEEVSDFIAGLNLDGKYLVVKENPSPDFLAGRLAEGKVLSRFCGRMEFGARALGNRSILADPRSPSMIRKINEKIKNRDFWMPFAPVILNERAGDYLMNHKNIDVPYMAVGCETTKQAVADLPAALHPYDFTCRPQLLDRTSNPSYYDLVKAFEAKTGCGSLLNTSFNIHGEPIVASLADAWDVFIRSGLDGIIFKNFYIEKVDRQGTA